MSQFLTLSIKKRKVVLATDLLRKQGKGKLASETPGWLIEGRHDLLRSRNRNQMPKSAKVKKGKK